MPKRRKAAPEENSASEAREEHVETRRTRSGRALRAPSSQVPVRTPGRRTRRSVLQELPAAAEEQNTESPERRAESPVKKSSLSEPEPAEPPEDEEGTGPDLHTPRPADPDLHTPRPAPAETVPEGSEPTPKKKPALEPNKPIPLGKPKSGRVWKDRNKQR